MTSPGRRPVIGICTDLEEGLGERAKTATPPFYFLRTSYAERVIEAGGTPLLLTMTREPEVIEGYLDAIDGLLATGSGIDIPAEMFGHERHEKIGRLFPAKTFFEVEIIKAALAHGVPFLGICNGMQAMNIAYGGTLWQDLPSQKGVEHLVKNATEPCHPVTIEKDSRLASVLGGVRWEVNSSHHQAVREPGAGLTVTAHAPDGTIEAIEDRAKPFALGVQWHPELIPAHANSRGLFKALVDAARAAQESRRSHE